MADKSRLIEKILGIELNMFLKVPTGQPTMCQESREGFKLMRGATFESWSENTLQSYLNDLFAALKKNRNLMTEKYARMDNLIPPINTNPLIDEMVNIESNWQAELSNKYPHIIGHGQVGDYCGALSSVIPFSVYLKSEMETYSDETLESYHNDLQQAVEEKRNLGYERYTRIFQRLGYSSLEEADQKVAQV